MDDLKYCVTADYIHPEQFFDGKWGANVDDLYFDEAKELAEQWQNDGVHTNVVMCESDEYR